MPRLPTAVLATGLMLIAFLSWTCGAILGSVSHSRRELRRLAYLSIPRGARRPHSLQPIHTDETDATQFPAEAIRGRRA